MLDSDRWLDLPSDTDRTAYIVLRIKTDDFGNIEAGPRKIFRLLEPRTQIKTEETCAIILSHLADVDLIRYYKISEEAKEREFIHLPRSRPTGSYLVRKCPPSPWCDPDTKLGKHVRSVRKQSLAKNIPVTSLEHNGDVSQGVGVGVGKGELPSARKRAGPDSAAAKAIRQNTWTAYSDAYEFRYGVPPVRDAKANVAIKNFCRSIAANECSAVAQFYLQNSSSFYVGKGHAPIHLAADAAKLRTEWATGRQITNTEAMLADKTAARKNTFQPLIDEAKQREKQGK